MHPNDLKLLDHLDGSPEGGQLRFAGERVLLFDALAMGYLRKELVDLLGLPAARALLARVGYAHGRRVAEMLRDRFPWSDDPAWRLAGSRIHELWGWVGVESVDGPDATGEVPLAQARWIGSYEAEQHRLHFGDSGEPVCWTLAGFASGYLSFCRGTEILCVESECVARGDAQCRVVGKPVAEWDDATVDAHGCYREIDVDRWLDGAVARLRETEQRLESRKQELESFYEEALPVELVARSRPMRKLVELARRVAPVDSTVLITGESGTGKERIARMIHGSSPRAEGPFVAVNCGALTESLLESELFGHARGAFTGATDDRAGLFEAAEGGTLMLDEVGETSPAMQVKLLRVLQERTIRRVGETHERSVDVRVLAATHRDLQAEARAGRFREDLLYRLRVVELALPPLRERRSDILPLARAFLERVSERYERPLTGFTPQAADRLLFFDWPGNVRQLENAVEHAVVLAGGERVDVGDLPPELRQSETPRQRVTNESHARSLADIERDALRLALERNDGHRERTAAELGIGTATLYRKIKRYGLQERSR